jgi:hypothetical protein
MHAGTENAYADTGKASSTGKVYCLQRLQGKAVDGSTEVKITIYALRRNFVKYPEPRLSR